ncbi:hypothetical protein GGC65_001470 [Sphingopyxis sp. OAS728]|uniref:hypothetical protein n=1 Tax=Sphingopyxis sp. OAS728 TaxID=2663823 RepID=UPI00178BCF77|nr:hypothetical protein [Sphingopyxis sp. OAS728]MBE1527014.1 hypothetical protein [Sphingopyxis sp. OAS728]
MNWLFDAILATAVSIAAAGETPPSTKPYSESPDIVDERARSGDLTIGAETGRDTPILEVQTMGCLVAFKTAIDRSGFKATVVQLGDGSSLDLLGAANAIRIQSSPDLANVLTLRSKQPIGSVFDALKGVQKGCRESPVIF